MSTRPEAEWRRWGAIGPLLEQGFSIVPNVVLRDRSLSGFAKLTWALLYDYAHRKADAAMLDLQADLGVGEKPTRAALRELEDAGLVERQRHGLGRPNSYSLRIPPNLILPEGGSRTAAAADPTRARANGEDELQDEEVEAKASTSRRGTTDRPANVVFDAMVAATAANPADGGMIGKAIKAIRAAETDRIRDLSERFLAENPSYDAVPADRIDKWLAAQIIHRAAEYRQKRPEWELTPTALAKHWNRVPTWQQKGGGRMTAADIARLDG